MLVVCYLFSRTGIAGIRQPNPICSTIPWLLLAITTLMAVRRTVRQMGGDKDNNQCNQNLVESSSFRWTFFSIVDTAAGITQISWYALYSATSLLNKLTQLVLYTHRAVPKQSLYYQVLLSTKKKVGRSHPYCFATMKKLISPYGWMPRDFKQHAADGGLRAMLQYIVYCQCRPNICLDMIADVYIG
jgi:hypothetical protein